MSIDRYRQDHALCLQLASELLGERARAVELDWELEQILRPRLRLEARRGAGTQHAVVRFNSGAPGHELAIGAELFRVADAGRSLRVARVVAPHRCDDEEVAYKFWAVAEGDYRQFYGLLRRMARRRQDHCAPIMPPNEQARLWDNTIGFLRRDGAVLRRFGVPCKRGVLLLGEPGNGKTMACRWLRAQCCRHGLAWRSVSAEDFEDAKRDGEAHKLFDLARPGIVFFDDLDMALRVRDKFEQTGEQNTFLAGLDGLDPRHGIVYLFTTNANQQDLDPAFCRPGRIDVVMRFLRPDAALRRRLIETWDAAILDAISIERPVADAEGLSFAELEEIKRLLVLGYLEHGRWDWQSAVNAFQSGRPARATDRRIGFKSNGKMKTRR